MEIRRDFLWVNYPISGLQSATPGELVICRFTSFIFGSCGNPAAPLRDKTQGPTGCWVEIGSKIGQSSVLRVFIYMEDAGVAGWKIFQAYGAGDWWEAMKRRPCRGNTGK